jgi:hypothetical protein
MAIDMGCLSCDTFRDKCIGKETAGACFRPLDTTRKTEADAELTFVPESVGPVAIPSPLTTITQLHPKTSGESRQAKFARIGKKRQEQTLEAIRKLGHLANGYHRGTDGVQVYTYEWTEQQAENLLKPIEDALALLRMNLLQPAKDREHGLIRKGKDVPNDQV